MPATEPGAGSTRTRAAPEVPAEPETVVPPQSPSWYPSPGPSAPSPNPNTEPSRGGVVTVQLLSGDRLSIAAVRRLGCDSEIVRVILGPDGEILDVGRAHRLVTPGLWNALVFRDRHCAFNGCTHTPLRLRCPPHRPLG